MTHKVTPGRNRYGLARHALTESIKKIVRHRAGFGCVICCDAIFTYEHFNPPFSEARKHDPNGITLLCGSHQTESMKGLLSKYTIAEADANPCPKEKGHAKSVFDLGSVHPTLRLGSTDFVECGEVFEINGEPYIEVRPPEAQSRRWRLSAKFRDRSGQTICEIVDNELRINAAAYDFRQTAKSFEVYEGNRSKVLALELDPPSRLIIRKLRIEGTFGLIDVDDDEISISTSVVSNVTLRAVQIYGYQTGIRIDESGAVIIGPAPHAAVNHQYR